MRKIRYLIGTVIAIVFLLQSAELVKIFPVEDALSFLGQSNDPLLIFVWLFVSFFIVIILDRLAGEAFKRKFSTNILDYFSNSLMGSFAITFFAFWITAMTLAITSDTSFFDVAANPSTLNYYVFWLILQITFIRFAPMSYEERKEFNETYENLKNQVKQGKIGILDFIRGQQKIGKELMKNKESE